MMRIACVDVPAFPLQLARRAHPEWRGHTVVVLDRDSPRGIVLWANEAARKLGVLPGLRYAAGLSLDSNLRAAVVEPSSIALAVAEVVELLRRFSPTVEPSPLDEPGTFWLDASGLSLLWDSPASWAESVRSGLGEAQLTSGIAVGFSRFGSYATARARAGRDHIVWSDHADERRAMLRVPLSRIGVEPDVRDALAQLGVTTLGQLQRLPESGLRRRFGQEVQRLHRHVTGNPGGVLDEPLTPAVPDERFEKQLDFDDVVADREALGFFVKQLLDPLGQALASRGQALRELTLTFTLERAASREETLRPAEPTLDMPQLHNLIRLRLESAPFTAGATAIALRVLGQRATREQLTMFFSSHEKPRRDLGAADRALARLRASLGEHAVVHAKLKAGHLPEAGFTWEPLEHAALPSVQRVHAPPLVRRFYTRAETLPPRPAREPDGWLLRGIPHGAVEQLSGPFSISGGWWNEEVRRDYYFAQLALGGLCWIYFDHKRARWFLHGEAA